MSHTAAKTPTTPLTHWQPPRLLQRGLVIQCSMFPCSITWPHTHPVLQEHELAESAPTAPKLSNSLLFITNEPASSQSPELIGTRVDRHGCCACCRSATKGSIGLSSNRVLSFLWIRKRLRKYFGGFNSSVAGLFPTASYGRSGPGASDQAQQGV